MARSLNKLTVRSIETLKRPGRHADGGGLYLHVSKGDGINGRRWIYRFTSPVTGKIREMGLGSASGKGGVSLARARELAAEARELVRAGRDPIEHRKLARVEAERASERGRTFRQAVDEFLLHMEPSWRNAKHRQQWRNTLSTYGKPIANMPVDRITTEDVLSVLTPIWQAKPETASRVRGRIERVLSFAGTKGWRDGPNPAVWRGTLDTVLPRPGKLRRGHFKALPYSEVPAFVSELREHEALSARMMEFVILTACRTQEALGARWDEFDLDGAVWTIPASRMKAQQQHRVPLSNSALGIVASLKETAISGFVFPGQKQERPLSNMTLLSLLRRMGRQGITTHGFRSAFSDWCSEKTDFSAEVREMALAHTIRNKAEAAYRRGDLLEKRRPLMDAWAAWCGSEAKIEKKPHRGAGDDL